MEVTAGLLRRLRPHGAPLSPGKLFGDDSRWMDDKIIAIYGELLKERFACDARRIKILNSQFMSFKLKPKGFADLFTDYDTWLVPVNKGNWHWGLLVIDRLRRTFTGFDSAGNPTDMRSLGKKVRKRFFLSVLIVHLLIENS